MVLVVEYVHEVRVKRMDVVELGKFGHHRGQLVVERLLRKFHLLRVELSNAGNLEVPVNDSWRLSLGFGQDNVHEVFGSRNDRNLLEVVVTHGQYYSVELQDTAYRSTWRSKVGARAR